MERAEALESVSSRVFESGFGLARIPPGLRDVLPKGGVVFAFPP